MTIYTTQGSRYRGFEITFRDKRTGDPVDLTGATFTGRLILLSSHVSRDIDGEIDGVDLENGLAQWDPGEEDVGTAGSHEIQITAAVGELTIATFRERFHVEAAIPEPPEPEP